MMKLKLCILFASVAIAVMASSAFCATLLSHYAFDNDFLNEVAGSPDGFPINSPAFTMGYDGTVDGAVSFNGTDQYLITTQTGHPNAAEGLGSGSVCFWLKSDDVYGELDRAVMGSLNYPPDATAFVISFSEQTTPRDTTRLMVRGADYTVETLAKYTSTGHPQWRDGTWHHFAYTWDAATKTIRIYIDGVEQSLSTSTGGNGTPVNLNAWQYAMTIGAVNSRGTVTQHFRGMFDEFRIYENQLTAVEIEQLAINPLKASAVYPMPDDENVPVTVTLDWEAGQDPANPGNPNPEIQGHILYIGTSPGNLVEEAVLDASVTDYEVTLLAGTTYYWRVDEAVSLPPYGQDDPNVYVGEVWSFDTEEIAPVITMQPVDQWAKTGEDATFELQAYDPAGGGVHYKWYKYVANDPNIAVGTDSRFLTVSNVSETDAGEYFCVVSNASTSVGSWFASLKIKEKIAHYKLDDGAGSVAIDENGINGTISGGGAWLNGLEDADTFTSDKGAFSFDGNTYIDITTDGAPNNSIYEAYRGSISFWARKDNASNAYIAGTFNDGAATSGLAVNLDLNATISVRFYLRAESGNVIEMSTNEEIWDDGNWHHCVITWNRDNDEENAIFVDGYPVSLMDSFTNFGITSVDTIAPWQYSMVLAGLNNRGTISPSLEGDLDDYQVYNYALNHTEVAAIYTDFVDDHICTEPSPFDFDGNCIVNFEDFSDFAAEWLDCGIVPDCLP